MSEHSLTLYGCTPHRNIVCGAWGQERRRACGKETDFYILLGEAIAIRRKPRALWPSELQQQTSSKSKRASKFWEREGGEIDLGSVTDGRRGDGRRGPRGHRRDKRVVDGGGERQRQQRVQVDHGGGVHPAAPPAWAEGEPVQLHPQQAHQGPHPSREISPRSR